jgi:hypothetical protein
MRDHDLILGIFHGVLSSPKYPDQLWGTTILLFNRYHMLLPRG